jgi:hypothetical protein
MLCSGVITGIAVVVLFATTCGGAEIGSRWGIATATLGTALGGLIGVGIVAALIHAVYRMLAADYTRSTYRLRIAVILAASGALTGLGCFYVMQGNARSNRLAVGMVFVVTSAIIAVGHSLPSPGEDRREPAP